MAQRKVVLLMRVRYPEPYSGEGFRPYEEVDRAFSSKERAVAHLTNMIELFKRDRLLSLDSYTLENPASDKYLIRGRWGVDEYVLAEIDVDAEETVGAVLDPVQPDTSAAAVEAIADRHASRGDHFTAATLRALQAKLTDIQAAHCQTITDLAAAAQLARELKQKLAAAEAALGEAEACMSIVEPRSDKTEYLRILGVVRAALPEAKLAELTGTGQVLEHAVLSPQNGEKA